MLEIGTEFPPESVTSLCPNLIAVSQKLKVVLIVELTVPWKKNITKRHEYKVNKYADISSNIRQKGFVYHLNMVEVAARGLCQVTAYSSKGLRLTNLLIKTNLKSRFDGLIAYLVQAIKLMDRW